MRIGLAVIVTMACAGAALAQQPSPYAPVETPTIDPKSLSTPQKPLPAHAPSLAPDKTESATPKLTTPSVTLGNSQLEFDARRTKDVTAPGLSTDSGETSNLSASQGQKEEPATPNYFGLKLSTPTK